MSLGHTAFRLVVSVAALQAATTKDTTSPIQPVEHSPARYLPELGVGGGVLSM